MQSSWRIFQSQVESAYLPLNLHTAPTSSTTQRLGLPERSLRGDAQGNRSPRSLLLVKLIAVRERL